MADDLASIVADICDAYAHDRTRLVDIVRDVQARCGCIDSRAMGLIAERLSIRRVEVEAVVSFYAFLSDKPTGRVVIRLCNDIVDRLQGVDRVAEAFSRALGVGFGQTTPDGRIRLEHTPCIGMCDQAPAALINDVVFTELSSDEATEIARKLQAGATPEQSVRRFGDGNNAHELVRSMVMNNLRRTGPVVFAPLEPGQALGKALALSPAEVIRDIKTARLRGRGGAGFPVGMKWEFTRAAEGPRRYVLCNADEGEPGTFKDRVILTECPDLVFEGMTIAGYAIGSDTGIVYLRAEYAYLRRFLEHVLAERRAKGLLGKNVGGKAGFDFDIRIQMGAGSYLCGEETAMINSCQGLPGEPRNRPPFPARKGYLDCPTTVNNVETFCCAARILEKGPGWFNQIGTPGSAGTKVLSISGDCKSPGVYELPFGVTVRELLELVGAEDAFAVQIGGPSGQMIAAAEFDRSICYDDLATGGAVTIFGPHRDILQIVDAYLEFFTEESCGFCTPCRVGNVLLRERIGKIMRGQGAPADLDYLQGLGRTMKATARCGLGQTSANPVLSTLRHFRGLYEALVRDEQPGLRRSFSLKAALEPAAMIANRPAVRA